MAKVRKGTCKMIKGRCFCNKGKKPGFRKASACKR